MDLTTITTFISSVGFPIAMCAALFIYMTKQEERHSEDKAKMIEAINNNTTVLAEIKTMLGGTK
jgi:hypothetical protein